MRVMGRDWVKCYFAANEAHVWGHFLRGMFNSSAEGGWSLCETKATKAVLSRLKKDGVPNKAVEEHFNDTKKNTKPKRKRYALAPSQPLKLGA
jgi:hypothetical protein